MTIYDLKGRERAALDSLAERQQLFLSSISLWEAQMLHSKSRLQLPQPFSDWLRRASCPSAALETQLVIAVGAR